MNVRLPLARPSRIVNLSVQVMDPTSLVRISARANPILYTPSRNVSGAFRMAASVSSSTSGKKEELWEK